MCLLVHAAWTSQERAELLSTDWVHSDSCSRTESRVSKVLRPSQTHNHHSIRSHSTGRPVLLILCWHPTSRSVLSENMWRNVFPVSLDARLSFKPSRRESREKTQFFSLLFRHLIPLNGRVSPEFLCKLECASAGLGWSLSVTETRWKSEGTLAPPCLDSCSLTQMFPLLSCAFFFSSGKRILVAWGQAEMDTGLFVCGGEVFLRIY